MPLTPSQITELKKQLSTQIQHLPPDQKDQAQAQIDSMSPEALEIMLKQQEKNIFRLIASKQVESTIINEGSQALAVLDINPLSKGHTLVIPKSPIQKKNQLPRSIIDFAKKMAQKIQINLNPKKVNVLIQEKLGEIILEIIPEYETPITQNSPRNKTSKEELEKIAEEIKKEIIKKPKSEIIKKTTQKPERIKMSRRIP